MINYPIKKNTSETKILNKTNKKQPNYNMANRGMNLEHILNETNEYYRVQDMAVIYKKPVPVQIVKVDYPSRNKAVITEAYYRTPSTTDYNGIYKGRYIDFEAKENKNKTSFPMRNVEEHQVKHLMQCMKHGGISFLIIYWVHKNEYFLYPIEKFAVHYNSAKADDRKSITYETFLVEAYKIEEKYLPRLDYLSVIDKYYIK